MESRCVFLKRMGPYASRFVFVLLDDPSDLVRASAVPDPGDGLENILQSFKLPRPVLCIGGVLKIELLAWDASVPKYFPDAEVASTVDEVTGTSSWTEAILNALLRPLQLTEKEEFTEQKPLSDSS